MNKNNNKNKNKVPIIFALLIVLVLFIIYTKQREQFSNRTKKHFNYSNLLSKSSPPWVQTTKTLDEIQYVLLEIITLINKETNKEFYVGNIDNITKDKLEDANTHYLIDLFLFEKKENFTIRVIIDFTIDKNNNVIINTITKSNANKYNYSTTSSNPYNFESCITDKNNQLDKIHIKGFNEISLPHALYDGSLSKTVPTIPEFNIDILPVMLQKDVNYNKLKKKQLNDKTVNSHKCYDRFGILNDDPKKCKCFPHNKTQNIKNNKKKLLITQPLFNPTLHKNISDKNENSWLFAPTRTDITNIL